MSNRIIKAERFHEHDVCRVDPPEPRLFFASEEEEVVEEVGMEPEEKARLIVTHAMEEAEKIRMEVAKQGAELKERAQQEGYAQGYQEGRAAAVAELEEEQAEIGRLLTEAEEGYKRRIWESEGEILKLACDIAEEISRASLSVQHDDWIGMVREAIGHVAGAKELLLRVSSQDEEVLKGNLTAIRDVLTESAPIRIEVDPNLKPGDLWVESNIGQVDARITQQVRNIFNELRAAVAES